MIPERVQQHAFDVFLRWVNHVHDGKLPPCPSCAHPERTFGGVFGLPGANIESNALVFGAVAPLILIVCNRCALAQAYSWQIIERWEKANSRG